ncbi:MAG: DUF4177 domain-containing protein [Clostridiales bacterium]|jgi:hypothetical protein|nr:DUF4177 domain-containing protein [Clostridiales bacterium]
MRKFEHKVLPIKTGGIFITAEKAAENIQEELDALGAEGWELVESSGNAALEGFLLLFFKRELTAQ